MHWRLERAFGRWQATLHRRFDRGGRIAIEAIFRVRFLPRDVYFISELPSDVRLSDVVTVGLMAFGLSVLATLYPSRRAAQVQPAEALRYE
jgi:lipoprotein-releasing system permease protein